MDRDKGHFMRSLILWGVLGALLSLGAASSDPLPEELRGATEEPSQVKKLSVPSDAVTRQLAERQQDLDRREAAVRREEERLKLLRSDIQGLLKKQEGQVKGGAPAGKATTASAATAVPNIVLLSQAFETMPVEEAAQRIEKMNESVALNLLTRLKSKTAGQILAALNPAKAAHLVEKMADGRQPSNTVQNSGATNK
jgi:flagellar motility protein MotE (MotC chaperone)